MTREEAIKVLESVRKYTNPKEAFDMAIEALSIQEPQGLDEQEKDWYDKYGEEVDAVRGSSRYSEQGLEEAAVQAHIQMEEGGEDMTFLNTFKAGAEWMAGQQAEKDTIAKIHEQIERGIPDNPEGDEYIFGERVAFRSVLNLLKETEKEL